VADEPVGLAGFLRRLAEVGGAPAPVTVPKFLIGLFAPYVRAALFDTDVRLSNAAARTELGWQPRWRSPLEGLPAAIGQPQQKTGQVPLDRPG